MNSCESGQLKPETDYTGQKGVIYDIEGNIYKTIGIGSQIWMEENLRTTKLNDNTELIKLRDSSTWINRQSAGFCWYNNDSTLKIPYGALYNWKIVNTGKLCPIGWHIPTKQEWTTLMEKLGGKQEAGGKLKVIGSTYWKSPNSGATNSSKFTAVPGGGIFSGQFFDFNKWAHWWSITQIDSLWVTTFDLVYNTPGVIVGPGGKTHSCGLSVRCIKDKGTN